MSTSRYIARLMGPLLLTLGLGMVFGLAASPGTYMTMMKQFAGEPSFVFVVGMLALVAGLAIVNAHNVWVGDWRVIITILGWLAVIRGILSLLFPVRLHGVAERVLADPTAPTIGAVITIVLGALLTWVGYEHLWAQKPAPAAKPAARAARTRAASARKAAKRAPARKSRARKRKRS
ncbi:MAG: hypothetical protein R3D30_07335 [Hyphomicrobiales bacterium]